MDRALIGAGATVLVGCLVFLGTWITSRVSKHAGNETVRVEERRVDLEAAKTIIEGSSDLLANYREEIKLIPQLREEINELRTAQDEDRRKAVEDRRRNEARWHVAVGYIRQLLTKLLEHDIEPPPRPDGLDELDDDAGFAG